MFDPVTLPFGAKMLFNTVTLKPGVKFEDVEMAVGEMCNVVKETYGGDKGGFIAGQVFRFSGFVSDAVFANKFEALAKMCSDSKELGYDMLWQGAPETT